MEVNNQIANQINQAKAQEKEIKKRNRDRTQISKDFLKFQDPDNFNLKLFRLKCIPTLPSFDEIVNILGTTTSLSEKGFGITFIQVDAFVYDILRTFTHWGDRVRSYNYQVQLSRVLRGLPPVEPEYMTLTPTVLIGEYSHADDV
jgi:hypothetical protein